ncbi:MAG: hypothetical protein MJB14_23430 [Spirochaetes bacterium]|nr:hypothetical protein [Spirochaetota bacterium]
MIEVKPDILINYQNSIDAILPTAVIYVRPRTNLVKYEKDILLGVQPFGDVIYLANLNGRLFIQNALILEHYSTEYKFAMFGKAEIARYSEMINTIENYFHINFEEANIIGAFESLIQLNLKPDQLFNIIVDQKDFLRVYGQTIKKIDDYYVVNYDIPAILNNYTPETNIFVIVIRLKDPNTTIQDIDQSIFLNIKNDKNTPIIDEDKLKNLSWFEKIRRTYHISHNHLTALFDMLDFVFVDRGNTVDLDDIPFTKKLFENKIIDKEKFLQIKEYNLVYIRKGNEHKLVNIADAANNLSILECQNLLASIIWT